CRPRDVRAGYVTASCGLDGHASFPRITAIHKHGIVAKAHPRDTNIRRAISPPNRISAGRIESANLIAATNNDLWATGIGDYRSDVGDLLLLAPVSPTFFACA